MNINNKNNETKKRSENRGLLQCYTHAETLIELKNTLMSLPANTGDSFFDGGFKEFHGSLKGLFHFHRVVSLGFPGGLDLFQVTILPEGKFIYSYSDTLTGNSEKAKETFDKAEVYLAMLKWAGQVDPDFDKRVEKAITTEKKNSYIVKISLDKSERRHKYDLECLIEEFKNSHDLKIEEIKSNDNYDYEIKGYIPLRKPLTNEDKLRIIQAGARSVAILSPVRRFRNTSSSGPR
jgi:hypothetical protein